MCNVEFAHVNKVAGDCGGGGHHWAHEMGAAVATLPAFEVAVRGAGATFVWRQNVCVHADAHTAPSVPPLESCFGENFVEALFFRGVLDTARTRNNERLLDGLRDVLAGYEMRCGT